MKRSKIFDDKRLVMLLALLLAATAWVIIAGFVNPGSQVTIPNVVIDYERGSQAYADRNLQIVGTPESSFADVRVQGDGSVLGTLNEESVTVYVDYSGVTGPGEWELPLRVERLTTGFTVVGVSVRAGGHDVERNPKDTATVVFEEVSRATFTVTPRTDDISAENGYVKGTQTTEPTEVTITGPKTRVDQIAQVLAVVTEEAVLTETTRYTGVPLTLIDLNGEEMDQSEMSLVFSSSTVTVTVPVLERHTINLDVRLIATPQDFDEEWLREKLQLSYSELVVVGTSSAFTNLNDPYFIQDIDISMLEPGWESNPITITLPEGLRAEDELRQVTVTLDSSEMKEVTIEVPASSVSVDNQPSNATVRPVADSISVRLLGAAEQIDAVLAENISVVLDASSVSVSGGSQQTVRASIRIPKFDRVFAISGQEGYTMVCDVVVN